MGNFSENNSSVWSSLDIFQLILVPKFDRQSPQKKGQIRKNLQLKGSKVMASENWGWNWWNQSKYKVFNDPQGVCIWLVKPFFLFTPAGEWMCIPYGIHPHRSMDHDSWRIFAVAWWHVHSIQYISDMYMIICICICICICKCMYVVYIYMDI